jgi:pyrroline-5-carboxylate reductase
MSVVGVIGTGNMGGALVKGWSRSAPADLRLLVWDKVEAAAERLLQRGTVAMATGPEDLVDRADVVVVVVKPKDADEVLRSVAPLLGARHVVVSSMAGVTLASLRAMVGRDTALMRIMPNLGVEYGVGAVAVAAEPGTAPATVAMVTRLLAPLGLAEVLPEEMIDAVTAVSGSGPGFLALAIESMEDGAVAAGLARPLARSLVRQAALECAGLLSDHSDSPQGLRDHLATTAPLLGHGIDTLERRGVRSAFQQAVEAAVGRSRRSGGRHVSPR